MVKREYTITLYLDLGFPTSKEDVEIYINEAVENYFIDNPAFEALRWKVEEVK